MTLDDLERQNRFLCGFFGDLGLRDTFQERIHYRYIKTYEIFSIELRFQRSKSQSSRFKETCARGLQRAVPHKSRYFTVVSKFTMKTVADRHGHSAHYNNPL